MSNFVCGKGKDVLKSALHLSTFIYIYDKALCSCIYICIDIAGQTAGPRGLTFFEGTLE